MTPPIVLQQGFNAAVNSIVNDVVRFVPRLFWAIVVLVVGIGIAIFVSGRVRGAIDGTGLLSARMGPPIATGVKLLLYFFVVTIVLSELGVDVGVLVVFLDGIAFGLGAGIALAVGIALGWGSKDYVAEHVEEWIDVATADGVPPTDEDGGNDRDDGSDEGGADGSGGSADGSGGE